MRKNVARALALGAITAIAFTFTACGGNKKEETTVAKQGSSVETKAGETIKAGESKIGETTKADGTRADVSKKGDKAVDAKEPTMVGVLDEVKDFAFTFANERDTAYRFTFEQGKIPEGLSDVGAGDKITVTYTGMISETNSFEDMTVSVKEA